MARGKPAAQVPAVQERPKSGPPAIVEADEAMLAELEGVEAAGLSDNIEDRGIPFIYTAQKGSKQVNPKEATFIKGLNVGMLFNTLTGEFWEADVEAEDSGLILLPCFHRTTWNEWTPQDQGGGFHGTHPRDTPLLSQGKPVMGASGELRRDIYALENGHELVLTQNYYCVIEESWSPVMLALSSTNLSASQKLQGLISAQKVKLPNGAIVTKPAFWSRFRFQTVYSKNDSGDWYKIVVNSDGPNEDAGLREFCKEFSVRCAKDQVKVSTPPGGDNNDAGTKEVPV